ncbi:MAG TPA: nitroreductase family protein [Armatimonadota bacterium]|nr:nitroreductase family protein [Armatimonadota bacterium]
MEFFDTVRNRHSVRSYQPRELEEEKLNTLVEAVNLAPSAGDLQGYEVIVVRSTSTKEALARAAYGQSAVTEAPMALVFCADRLLSASKYGRRGAELYAVQDATIAAAYCQLAATALGLATVWIGAFDPDAVAAAIESPQHVTPIAILPVGYPAEEPRRTPRRPPTDLVRNEKF